MTQPVGDSSIAGPSLGAEPAEITQPLPDPPKATGNSLIEGLSGAWNKTIALAQDTGKKISENPHMQKVGEVAQKGYAATKQGVITGATKVGEVTKKGWDKANENEKVAKVVNTVSDATGTAYQKTKDATGKVVTKTKEVSGAAYDKTKVGLTVAGAKVSEVSGQIQEKSRPIVEKTKTALGVTKRKGHEIWTEGRGAIVKVKEQIDDLRWGGDAKAVLLQREESAKKWREIRIRGAEEIQVAARKEYTTNYFVEKGTMVQWSFRVKEYDIGFGVRIRVMQDGGSVEEDILGVEKFDATDTIEGSWTADEDRTIVLVFDNSKSLMRSKTVCYLVGVIPPEKEADVAQEADPAAVSAEDPAIAGLESAVQNVQLEEDASGKAEL